MIILFAFLAWLFLKGRVIGITVGCIIGMAPLLWFDHKDDKETK